MQATLGEQCDDHNTSSGDGCSSTCKVESCGDGIVDPGLGEECDDQNANDTDGCITTCKLARCGDGFLEAGVEACDDQNVTDNDGCSASCAVERCGDGVVQSAPALTSMDFEWLASSCTTPRPIDFSIDGVLVSAETSDPDMTCNCAPAGGFHTQTFTAPALLAQLTNGDHIFAVDNSGADQFLGWALVTLHAGAATTEIVVFEDPPGSATAHATSVCAGGFDVNITASTLADVPAAEACDDGNSNNGDACSNTCEVNP